MKKVFLSFVLFAAFASSIFANPVSSKEVPTQDLRKEVFRLIQNPELSKHGIKAAEVFVQFEVDEKGQINVLEVKSESDYLKTFITKRLNRQTLNIDNVPDGVNYNIKVAFESEL